MRSAIGVLAVSLCLAGCGGDDSSAGGVGGEASGGGGGESGAEGTAAGGTSVAGTDSSNGVMGGGGGGVSHADDGRLTDAEPRKDVTTADRSTADQGAALDQSTVDDPTALDEAAEAEGMATDVSAIDAAAVDQDSAFDQDASVDQDASADQDSASQDVSSKQDAPADLDASSAEGAPVDALPDAGTSDQATPPAGCSAAIDCGQSTDCRMFICDTDSRACSHVDVAAGTSCNEDGGDFCDGMSDCVEGFVALRVGDGNAALNANTTATSLQRFSLAGKALGAPIHLPTATAGSNQPVTIGGTATSDGDLTLSADGHYLTVAGYGAMPASAIGTSVRVVGRIDKNGAVDTSTTLSGVLGTNCRSAVAADESAFWISGNGSSNGTGGVFYASHGTACTSTNCTQIINGAASTNNVRFVRIFDGQLYGSSGSGTFTNVFTIGTGLPKSSLQTATPLPGLPTSNASPYAFVLLDRDPSATGPPGFDTLYIADGPGTGTGAIQKYYYDPIATSWKLAGTSALGVSGSGFRGLTGKITGSTVSLVTTVATGEVIVFSDTTAPTLNNTFTTSVATTISPPVNTAYRGVSLPPQ